MFTVRSLALTLTVRKYPTRGRMLLTQRSVPDGPRALFDYELTFWIPLVLRRVELEQGRDRAASPVEQLPLRFL